MPDRGQVIDSGVCVCEPRWMGGDCQVFAEPDWRSVEVRLPDPGGPAFESMKAEEKRVGITSVKEEMEGERVLPKERPKTALLALVKGISKHASNHRVKDPPHFNEPHVYSRCCDKHSQHWLMSSAEDEAGG
jgi:hypothetical protein